ncbi:hypothetical protein BDZ91DRAFT_786160 [Kalaharituber pfeilii]|nr:hypothetical protein BDZ91DRAFT_786160 [Kalaharituber pfeilii]
MIKGPFESTKARKRQSISLVFSLLLWGCFVFLIFGLLWFAASCAKERTKVSRSDKMPVGGSKGVGEVQSLHECNSALLCAPVLALQWPPTINSMVDPGRHDARSGQRRLAERTIGQRSAGWSWEAARGELDQPGHCKENESGRGAAAPARKTEQSGLCWGLGEAAVYHASQPAHSSAANQLPAAAGTPCAMKQRADGIGQGDTAGVLLVPAHWPAGRAGTKRPAASEPISSPVTDGCVAQLHTLKCDRGQPLN